MNRPRWERILLWLLDAALVALVIWACAASASAAPLPSFKQLPDYMQENHCDPFSKSAVAMLRARGIPAVRITYCWSRFGAGHGYHAAVLFRWEGKAYYMDNWRVSPRPVAGKTDLGCVNHIDGAFGTMCWMTDENCKRVPPRKLSELFE